MPVQVQQTTTATVTSMPWIPLNIHEDYAPISFHLTCAGAGDRTAELHWTLDDVVAGASAVAVTAFSIAGSAATLVTAGSFSQPISGIRVKSAAGSGAATVSLRILQAGI